MLPNVFLLKLTRFFSVQRVKDRRTWPRGTTGCKTLRSPQTTTEAEVAQPEVTLDNIFDQNGSRC